MLQINKLGGIEKDTNILKIITKHLDHTNIKIKCTFDDSIQTVAKFKTYFKNEGTETLVYNLIVPKEASVVSITVYTRKRWIKPSNRISVYGIDIRKQQKKLI